MTTPSVEERLRKARGFAAVLARLAAAYEVMSGAAATPACWSGIAEIADALEEDVAAVGAALAVEAKEL